MDEAFAGADVVYPKSWAPYHVMEKRTELLRSNDTAGPSRGPGGECCGGFMRSQGPGAMPAIHRQSGRGNGRFSFFY